MFSFKKTLSFRSTILDVGGCVWWVGVVGGCNAGWVGRGGRRGGAVRMLKEGSAEKDAPTGLLAVLNTL